MLSYIYQYFFDKLLKDIENSDFISINIDSSFIGVKHNEVISTTVRYID